MCGLIPDSEVIDERSADSNWQIPYVFIGRCHPYQYVPRDSKLKHAYTLQLLLQRMSLLLTHSLAEILPCIRYYKRSLWRCPLFRGSVYRGFSMWIAGAYINYSGTPIRDPPR